jgi:hypothetical protein
MVLTPHTPGKAYHIKEITKGSYFYPKSDGLGEVAESSRPLKNGELVSAYFAILYDRF